MPEPKFSVPALLRTRRGLSAKQPRLLIDGTADAEDAGAEDAEVALVDTGGTEGLALSLSDVGIDDVVAESETKADELVGASAELETSTLELVAGGESVLVEVDAMIKVEDVDVDAPSSVLVELVDEGTADEEEEVPSVA